MRNKIIHYMTFMGTPPFYFMLSLPLLAFGMKIFVAYYISIAATEIICAIIKLATRTERPTPRKRVTLYDQYDASTFPSAHTARIASNTSIMVFYFWNSWSIFLLVPGAFLIASVAYSRIALKHHFIKDVMFGAIIGIAISFLTYIGMLQL
jgi:undecaprenyl-diphosphatase